MKTLMVYYSNIPVVTELCESAQRRGSVDVVRICDKYEKSGLLNAAATVCKAYQGKAVRVESLNVDFSAYDCVIVAVPMLAGQVHPAVNGFLHKTSLRGMEVYGLTLNSGKQSAKANDVLRKRIRLAGGHCRSVVSVSVKDLKNAERDILAETRLGGELSLNPA
ncbi:MAG: flavodoxin domain-containing protein [Oscillospiraceae bacterium]|nr:flavodoxin domain-containing protein [Oscillospiraceae bacterium]